MENRRLSKEIRTIHHEVNGIYGHRRIKAVLTAMGHECSRHRVARLMREAGLSVRSRKRWRLASSSRYDLPIAPPILSIDISKIADLKGSTTDCCSLGVPGAPHYLWNKQNGRVKLGKWVEAAAKAAGKS